MDNSSAIVSWSGGKDCCLACYKARQAGYRITHLLNFISNKSQRSCFHGIAAELMRRQAELMGIPLLQKETTADMQEYEKEFKEAVLAIDSVRTMIFGDIYLDEQKSWVDRVCGDMGVTPVEPLWHQAPAAVLEEFIRLGFQAIVISCQADKFGKEFVGRIVDRTLLRELTARSICPCGENGEYHTLVVNGPMFSRGIEILDSEPILKDGFWKAWFLDIQRFR